MFTTSQDVEDLTGYIVDDKIIRQSQAIVEVMAGKTESMVNPITQLDDLNWLKYAVAWQSAYMVNDSDRLYEQANVNSVSQNNFKIDFGGRVYAVSPLTVEAVKRLSWNKSKKVTVKPYQYDRDCVPYWWDW